MLGRCVGPLDWIISMGRIVVKFGAENHVTPQDNSE